MARRLSRSETLELDRLIAAEARNRLTPTQRRRLSSLRARLNINTGARLRGRQPAEAADPTAGLDAAVAANSPPPPAYSPPPAPARGRAKAAPAPRRARAGGAPATTGVSNIEGDAPPPAPPTMGDVAETDLKLEVARNYGYLAAYFDHQEIGPILREAAQWGWDEPKLMGRLFKTNWWQQTSAVARQWDALKATDPAEASRRVDQTGRLVTSVAGKLGLALTPERTSEIATTFMRLGWDDNDLQSALGNEFSYTPGQPYQGDMGKAIARFKELANAYMIPVDEQTAFSFAQKWMKGEADEDNTESYLRMQAISRFPQLKQYIDAGITPYDFFSPYRQEIGRMLGKSADTVDLMTDPKWSKIVDNVDDKGTRRPMTISEAQVYVRGLDEWRDSDEANKTVANVTAFLGQKMGVS